MLDSGYPAEGLHLPTRWVDNERVLFTAVQLGTYPCDHSDPTRCGPHAFHLVTSIWNVKDNSVAVYIPRILTDLCVHDGYISYKRREHLTDPQGSVFAGPFGKERRLGWTREYGYRNVVSCRYYHEAPKPLAEKRRAALLLEEHGYVDFGPDLMPRERLSSDDIKPILRSFDGKKAIRLDIEERYLQNRRLRFSYSPFLKEYFARADVIDASVLAPAFYLTPDGAVRKVEFGNKRKLGGAYYAVKPGIFISTAGDRLDGRYGGGYVLSSKGFSQVISGALQSVSVSPDGCKVAFIYASSSKAFATGYADWRAGKPGNTIRMIDLCAEVR